MRLPKRELKKLRTKAITAADEIARSENSWGARNVLKQSGAIEDLRVAIEESRQSIGSERVIFILNHNVPQIRSLLDLTSPKPGERGDLLPKQYVEAILSNIDVELDKIETQRDRTAARLWRWLGLPGIIVAVSGVAILVVKLWPQIKVLWFGR